MYRVLVADDNYEDRELLKLEITRALKDVGEEIKFHEAVSVKQASELLAAGGYDLLTLDIEFDRLNEGIEALPEFFETYPSLNIIIVSGKLNKAEVTEQLFRFTKDNVLKGKRWARHFDVLDKKDDKADAIRQAYSFSTGQRDSAEKVKDMLSMAESFLDSGEHEKCMETYKKIQDSYPGEPESRENIEIFKKGGYEQALQYMRRGEKLAASLLLGHHIESRLKNFTKIKIGQYPAALSDCIKKLEKAKRISPLKRNIFHNLIKLRNKSVHYPDKLTEQDFEAAIRDLKMLESDF